MQDKPLPLDVQLLAKRAESRNMFAKCLRYREREFNSLNILPSGECIEALISVNNELGLPDRAAGVLHYVNTHYSHISIEPQWLQKLCHWERARQSYLQQNLKWIESYPDDRPPKHPSWMAGEIGVWLRSCSFCHMEQTKNCCLHQTTLTHHAVHWLHDAILLWLPYSSLCWNVQSSMLILLVLPICPHTWPAYLFLLFFFLHHFPLLSCHLLSCKAIFTAYSLLESTRSWKDLPSPLRVISRAQNK